MGAKPAAAICCGVPPWGKALTLACCAKVEVVMFLVAGLRGAWFRDMGRFGLIIMSPVALLVVMSPVALGAEVKGAEQQETEVRL